MMFKNDENAPEYYVLECCVTDEMADAGLAMELRNHKPLNKLQKCGKPVDETQKLAMEPVEVGGCIFYSENGIDLFELTVFMLSYGKGCK